jgi:hypothetical protein
MMSDIHDIKERFEIVVHDGNRETPLAAGYCLKLEISLFLFLFEIFFGNATTPTGDHAWWIRIDACVR